MKCRPFSTETTVYHPFRYWLKSFTLSEKQRAEGNAG